MGGKKKERDEERGGTQERGRRHEVGKEEGQIKKQKEIGKEGKGKEAGEEKKGERRGRENIGIMKYACIRVNIVQTADLHVFDILGEISALDHLGLVTDPLFRGFVQLLVVVQ